MNKAMNIMSLGENGVFPAAVVKAEFWRVGNHFAMLQDRESAWNAQKMMVILVACYAGQWFYYLFIYLFIIYLFI